MLDPVVRSTSQAAKSSMQSLLEEYDLKGFTTVLVSKDVCDGISSIIQTAGLGGLRHNTVVCGWPDGWNKKPDRYRVFINTIRHTAAANNALLVPKNIDKFPSTPEEVTISLDQRQRVGEVGKGVTTSNSQATIDVWWIVHDGGLLMLLPHLLRQHRVWKHCRIRIFTVAQINDNSVKMKEDLKLFLYHLRIDAEIEVVELNDGDISAFTYERTMIMEQRAKLLRDMERRISRGSPNLLSRVGSPAKSAIKSKGPGRQKHILDPTLVADKHRSNTDLTKNFDSDSDVEALNPNMLFDGNQSKNDKTWKPDKLTTKKILEAQNKESNSEDLIGLGIEIDENSDFEDIDENDVKLVDIFDDQNTAGKSKKKTVTKETKVSDLLTVKPSQGNVKRMHNATTLNEVILSKSHASAMVILNLPSPPKKKLDDTRAAAYMEFLEVLTEGLERVLLIRGSGREVVTIYS